MTNMRILIRIVFIIFITNRIDCLGGVCDDCCECLKEDEKKEEEKKDENNDEKEIEEYEEIEEDEINTAKSLVNNAWYSYKEKDLVLKIFKKKDDNDIQDNGDKISIKFGKDNKNKNTRRRKYGIFVL